MSRRTCVNCAHRAPRATDSLRDAGRSDVLIWHLRGLPRATQRLDQLPHLTISAVTYLELLQGMRNQAEMIAVQKSLERRRTVRLPITPAITERAVYLMQRLVLSHGLQLGDALISATALEHDLPVLTANAKHFTPVPGLRVEAFGAN
jgi:predicted nucleic acid-binding protein